MKKAAKGEMFKVVEGYEELYQISNLGNLKILSREILRCDGSVLTTKTKISNMKSLWGGYRRLYLSKDGESVFVPAHRLVAVAFIPNPDNKPFVNHKNSVRDDNRVENLEWCTHSENMKHAYKVGNIKTLYHFKKGFNRLSA